MSNMYKRGLQNRKGAFPLFYTEFFEYTKAHIDKIEI